MALSILTDDIYQQMKINRVNWDDIVKEYILPENIIREFKDKWNWGYISYFQTLSYEFIVEFIEIINYNYLKYNANIRLTHEQWVVIENLKMMYKN